MASCDFFPDADGIRPYRYQDGVLHLLDQRRLPTEEVWLEYRDYQGVAEAIRTMVVRGAPAIGIAAAFGAWFGARDIAGRGLSPVSGRSSNSSARCWPPPGRRRSTCSGPWSG